jgi:hypothetical protein
LIMPKNIQVAEGVATHNSARQGKCVFNQEVELFQETDNAWFIWQQTRIMYIQIMSRMWRCGETASWWYFALAAMHLSYSSTNRWTELGNGKYIPVTESRSPDGCETSKLPHFLDNALTVGSEVVSLTGRPSFTPPPPGGFMLLIFVRGWLDSEPGRIR